MSLIKSRGDSNAPDKKGDMGTLPGDVAMLGYTKVPFPSEMPARDNKAVGITKNQPKAMADNQGTNMESYKHQPEEIDALLGD